MLSTVEFWRSKEFATAIVSDGIRAQTFAAATGCPTLISCQHALYIAHAATPTTVISARRSINTRAATEMGGSDRSCVGSLLRSNTGA